MPRASQDGESEEDKGDGDGENGDDEPGPRHMEVDLRGVGCAGLEGGGCASGTEAVWGRGLD